MNNYNIEEAENKLKPIDVATTLFNYGDRRLIPVPLKRPSETVDGKGSYKEKWNVISSYDEWTEAEVESTFRDAAGVGLLLINGMAVIDIDAVNVANGHGFEVAKLFGVDIYKNAFGRSLKTHGAIIVQTDEDMEHFKTPRNECEILCKTGADEYQQKVLPPSTIYCKKQQRMDQFKWRTNFQPDQLQYVEWDTLMDIAEVIAVVSHLGDTYPSEGGRDKAALCLMRILSLYQGVEKEDKESSEFVTKIINIVARVAHDKERANKKYHKQFAKLEEVNNPKGQLEKYWPDADADYILKLLHISETKEEEEEKETPRVRDLISASDFELEELPPQNWVMFRMLPRGDLTIASGDGGTGKTNFLIQQSLMSCVPEAYFTKLAPYGNKPYTTFLASNEDDSGVLRRRIAVHKKAIREVYPDYTGNFETFHAESFRDNPLRLVKKKRNGIPEVNNKDIKLLQEIVGDLKVDSLILDPISTLHIGMNENDNADMDFLIRKGIIAPLCQEMYINTVAVAHVAKGTNTNNDDIQASSWANRGATSIVAAARVALAFNRLTRRKIKELMGWTKESDIDSEIMLQMQRDYVHVTYGKNNNASITSGSYLKKTVKEYPNKEGKTISNIFYKEDNTLVANAEDAARAREEQQNVERESAIKSILALTKTNIDDGYRKWPLIDLARLLMGSELHSKSLASMLREDKKKRGVDPDKIEKEIALSLTNKLETMFNTPWKHPEYNIVFNFLHKEERIAKGKIVRWLEMTKIEDTPFPDAEEDDDIDTADMLKAYRNLENDDEVPF
jgi:hypothetical protein